MSPVMEGWMKSAAGLAVKAMAKGEPMVQLRAKERALAQRIPYLSEREVGFLTSAAMSFARGCRNDVGKMGKDDRLHRLQKAANEMDRRLQLKAKAVLVADAIEKGRHSEYPTVFFICSTHQKPAEDHRDFQGKVYVDVHWRQTLRERNLDALIPGLEKAIRQRGTRSVQWVMGPPAYMVTRPYCRHYFTPITIDEYLTKTPKQILADHPEAHMPNHRPMTRGQRYAKEKARFQYVRDVIAKQKTAV
jgi:hypothetical protein